MVWLELFCRRSKKHLAHRRERLPREGGPSARESIDGGHVVERIASRLYLLAVSPQTRSNLAMPTEEFRGSERAERLPLHEELLHRGRDAEHASVVRAHVQRLRTADADDT